MTHELSLADGSRFAAQSFGAPISASGELVFHTGMYGYTESLTDPSYKGQILVLSYPIQGNYGVPEMNIEHGLINKGFESEQIQISGLLVSNYSQAYSHPQAMQSLGDWLKSQNIPALTGIDTRALVHRLRTQGPQLAKIIANQQAIQQFDPNTQATVPLVSCKKVIEYGEQGPLILLVDFGVKASMIRALLARGCRVKRVPWDYDYRQEQYDALLLSNGPGNPELLEAALPPLQQALQQNKPILGICLGHQILAKAIGLASYKLPFGHRSFNQPVQDRKTDLCYLTSQNHGYAVSTEVLPSGWTERFRNLNDGSCEGLMHKQKPFLSVQFHPEAAAGPQETAFIFDEFLGFIYHEPTSIQNPLTP
jgi:carbamoyl-phosphate synthase small subunit